MEWLGWLPARSHIANQLNFRYRVGLPCRTSVLPAAYRLVSKVNLACYNKGYLKNGKSGFR